MHAIHKYRSTRIFVIEKSEDIQKDTEEDYDNQNQKHKCHVCQTDLKKLLSRGDWAQSSLLVWKCDREAPYVASATL